MWTEQALEQNLITLQGISIRCVIINWLLSHSPFLLPYLLVCMTLNYIGSVEVIPVLQKKNPRPHLRVTRSTPPHVHLKFSCGCNICQEGPETKGWKDLPYATRLRSCRPPRSPAKFMKIVPTVVTSANIPSVSELFVTNSTLLYCIDVSRHSVFSWDRSRNGRMSGLNVISLVWSIGWTALRCRNLGRRSISALTMLLLSSNTSTPSKWSWARWGCSRCCLATWCYGTICL